MAYDMVVSFLLARSLKKGYLEKPDIALGLPACTRDSLVSAGTALGREQAHVTSFGFMDISTETGNFQTSHLHRSEQR